MSKTASARTGPAPLIGVTACVNAIGDQSYHVTGEKYLTAVVVGAGGVPVSLPALERTADIPALLGRLDGLLVTGSPSNVEPARYGGPPSAPGTRHDPARDATTLPLIRAALDGEVPLFAICRGLQELNVALGGTLHQRIQELPGKRDHRAPEGEPIEVRYGPAHAISLAPEGRFAALAEGLAGTDPGSAAPELTVNSLHAQGIDRLAPGLAVEAMAPDGIIEAVWITGARDFAAGVQWHPEWRVADDALSMRLFAAFGEAARRRAGRRGAAPGGTRPAESRAGRTA